MFNNSSLCKIVTERFIGKTIFYCVLEQCIVACRAAYMYLNNYFVLYLPAQ